MSKSRFIILKITLAALMTALIYIVTAFLPIVYAGGSGYLNFSDGLIMFTTIFVGPIEGVFSAIFACAMADLTAGAANFIPFTICAKALESISCYLIYKILNKHKYLKYISCIIAPLFMVLTYMVAYLIMYGSSYLVNSLFDLIQGIAGTIISIVLLKVFEKLSLDKFKNSSLNN